MTHKVWYANKNLKEENEMRCLMPVIEIKNQFEIITILQSTRVIWRRPILLAAILLNI